ncbi:2-dehydro-3-deoxyphosphogluconate aldolase [Acidianus sulfidivorans JP7]|uniref:2-dehydro-3-deoxyphosphogluconate aldolase n=2 Tax=Acidianus TaxID=12914 RepID=A0A2U9IQG7_9CREN|nr:2-dehydro-3-deoxyphosphogluconate aldolase [Acidianus sulfidivorans JP7]
MDIVVPILTPFKDDKIDKEAVKTHVENLLKKGVDIIFVNGTTGLGPALSKEEKKEMLDAVLDVTNKVIFQVGSLNIKEVIDLVKYANDKDILAVASYPPYYFTLPETFIIKYFKEICNESKHDVYLYNYPGATGKDVNVNMVKQISCLKGVKDTNPDFQHTIKYKEIPGMKVYNGLEGLAIASMSILDGTVVGGGNYAPELFSQLREYIKAGDMKKAMEVQLLINKLIEVSQKYGQFAAVYELTKEFQGYDVGKPRAPIFPLDNPKELIEEARKIWNK